jgi:hypothetical protein
MASAVRQMTGVGGDIRKIARLLQKKAPPGHMLAYINQEEADLLKARGGSGQPHADTGVPSFETQAELDIYDQYYTGTPVQSMPDSTVTPLDLTSTQAPSYQTAGEQKYLADQSSPPAVDMSAVRDTANPLFPEYQQYLREQVGTSDAQIAAAYLHDVVEDTGVTIEQIEREFGTEITELVGWLTDVSKPSDGNRKVRKTIDREHTAKAPAAAKAVKLADLISNTKSIVKYDLNFAEIYLEEKMELLSVLQHGGDPVLWKQAHALCKEGKRIVEEHRVQKALKKMENV